MCIVIGQQTMRDGRYGIIDWLIVV